MKGVDEVGMLFGLEPLLTRLAWVSRPSRPSRLFFATLPTQVHFRLPNRNVC